ncbi:DUF2155 domain-containing protein [Pseudogemmobacter sp. W21_MBD1_M6]|uniref:DUF2155 domain-containing protein n=1 Tax=Pseudogemmobacter sp. W21_MBD1_M6 TaxID=3240271 RepID=UPI003F97AD7A
MIRRFALATILCAGTAHAQEVASSGTAVLRTLDKVAGTTTDVEINAGDSKTQGRLQVTLGDCRYPAGNPSGNAYAYLTIRDTGKDAPLFQGWMVASAPALNALDDPRYDVWVLRCKTS